jgi:hypothetical protein
MAFFSCVVLVAKDDIDVAWMGCDELAFAASAGLGEVPVEFGPVVPFSGSFEMEFATSGCFWVVGFGVNVGLDLATGP